MSFNFFKVIEDSDSGQQLDFFEYSLFCAFDLVSWQMVKHKTKIKSEKTLKFKIRIKPVNELTYMSNRDHDGRERFISITLKCIDLIHIIKDQKTAPQKSTPTVFSSDITNGYVFATLESLCIQCGIKQISLSFFERWLISSLWQERHQMILEHFVISESRHCMSQLASYKEYPKMVSSRY